MRSGPRDFGPPDESSRPTAKMRTLLLENELEDESKEGYTPPAGAKAEKGFQGLTGNENTTLFRAGRRTPTSYASKSRMPKGFTPRIFVPANKLPILSPAQIAAHEDAVENLVRKTGANDIVSLRPKLNAWWNEYLPAEHFSFNRPRNEKQTLLDLTLSNEEAREIFTEPSSAELEATGDMRRENTHIAEFLPADKCKSNFADSFAEGDAASNRGILKFTFRSRESNPSGLRGGSSTLSEEGIQKDLIRGKKIYSPNLTGKQQEGGWTFMAREERRLPTNVYAIENSSAFLRSLNNDELALSAAKQEPGFRVQDFARERGWGITYARRFQTEFNKRLALWKELGVDPNRIVQQLIPEEQNTR